MRNTVKRSAVIALLLILLPVPEVLANTTEETSVEESTERSVNENSPEQPVNEESTTQQRFEETTEASEEGEDNATEEPANEYVPPQNEQPQYEEPTETPYQSYEESTEEFYYEEETEEQTVDEWTEEITEEITEEMTEEVTEEPTEEVYVEPETVEEPAEVTINQAEVDGFSIAGEVTANDVGLEGVTVSLAGDKKEEISTDENGKFSFEDVPPGDYELQVAAPEGYTVEKETLSLIVEDRGKRGINFIMEEVPAEKSIETDEQVMADQDEESSNNMAIILVGVVLLSIVAILFIVRALRK